MNGQRGWVSYCNRSPTVPTFRNGRRLNGTKTIGYDSDRGVVRDTTRRQQGPVTVQASSGIGVPVSPQDMSERDATCATQTSCYDAGSIMCLSKINFVIGHH